MPLFIRENTVTGAYGDGRYWKRVAFALTSPPDFRSAEKKENQIFLIYKEIQNGSAAKSYMTNGLLIYGEIFGLFLIY